MSDSFKPIKGAETQRKAEFVDWVELNQQSAVVEEEAVETPQVEKITEEELELIKKQAYEEAYQQGLNQAQEKLAVKEAELAGLMETILNPVKLIDKVVQAELIELAIWLTEHILHTEISLNPHKLLNIFSEFIALLPSTKNIIKLALNNDDYKMVIELLEKNALDLPIEALQVDDALKRGEYRLETADSDVDGTVENRVRELVLHTLSTKGGVDE